MQNCQNRERFTRSDKKSFRKILYDLPVSLKKDLEKRMACVIMNITIRMYILKECI